MNRADDNQADARERLVALVSDVPGLSGKELWQRLQPRPPGWSMWDVTSILLSLAVGHNKRIRESSVQGGWRFWPLDARGYGPQGLRSHESQSAVPAAVNAQIGVNRPPPTPVAAST